MTKRFGPWGRWFFGPICIVLGYATAAQAQSQEMFDCIIDPARVVTVTTTETGLLSVLHVNRGDVVAAGQVLGALDSTVEETNVAVLMAQAQSDAEIVAQQARLDLARTQRDRMQTLVDRDIGAAGELEKAQAAVEVALGELAIAELRQRIAGIELQRAQQLLERRQIMSPIAGVVTEVSLSLGEYADPSNPVMQLAQLDPLHVEVFLPLSAYADVKVGDRAVVEPAAPIEGEYEGIVTVVDQVFDVASATFGLRVTLPNEDGLLPGGLRCRVGFP